MTRSLYLLGAPGVGKSSVMRELLDGWAPRPLADLWGLLKGHLMVETGVAAPYEPARIAAYLGVLREEFPGTDGLGMAAMPDAVRWVLCGDLPDVIFGEGARLGTTKFLVALDCWTDLTVVLLDAPDEVLDARRAARGSDQNDAWMRGARTRARNAADGAEAAGVRVLRVDATAPLDEVVETVKLVAP